MSSAGSRAGCATVSPSGTRRSRSRAATRAGRSTTERASTITRTPTWWLFLRQQRVLALKDPPRHRDSSRVGRVHAPIAEPPRAQRSRLRVGRVGRVVDDAEIKVRLRHVHALVDRVAVRLADLVASVEIRTSLHLDDGVPALVVQVEVLAVLQKRAADRHGALIVQG